GSSRPTPRLPAARRGSSERGPPPSRWSWWSRPARRRVRRRPSLFRLLEVRLDRDGLAAVLLEPADQRRAMSVRDPDGLSAGGVDGTEQFRPVGMVGEDEAAVERSAPARAANAHPARDHGGGDARASLLYAGGSDQQTARLCGRRKNHALLAVNTAVTLD